MIIRRTSFAAVVRVITGAGVIALACGFMVTAFATPTYRSLDVAAFIVLATYVVISEVTRQLPYKKADQRPDFTLEIMIVSEKDGTFTAKVKTTSKTDRRWIEPPRQEDNVRRFIDPVSELEVVILKPLVS